MKEEEIVALTRSIQAKLKRSNGDLNKCEWHESYKEQKELCDEIAVHAQRKTFPEKMMRSKAPNETDVELAYRKDNFEPITMPYWYRAVSSINGRIWSEQNHTTAFKDEDVKKYFLTDYPVYGSIFNYFKDIVTPYKVNDPNGVLVLKTGELAMVEVDGEEKQSETEPLKPTLQIYGCHKILAFELDEYAVLLSDDKSPVLFNGKTEKTGLIFYLYDTTAIYKIYQAGKKTDWNFESEVYYEHNLGYLPVWKLKGIPKQEIKDTETQPIYMSYFTPAIPLLNKAIKQDSTLDASISKTAFPVRAYYEDECDAVDCSGGKVPVYEEGKDVSYKACSKCGGSGKGGVRFSPLKDYVQRPPKKNITEEEAPLPFPAFAYVSPDTTILDFLDRKIKSDIIEAFTFINIDVSKKGDNTGSQTGIEVKIDREELFAFLLQFSSEVFALLIQSMLAVYSVRWINAEKKDAPFDIKKPKTFEIYDAEELTKELGEAKKAGAPEIAIREMTKELMSQRFSQQGDLPKIIELVFNVDAYATKDTTEVAILKSNNLITLSEAILHENIYQFINRMIAKDPAFLTWDLEKQTVELAKMADEKAAKLKPNTAASIVEELGQPGGAGGGVS